MANEFCEISILEHPLQVAPPVRFEPDAGAVVDFLGVVRGVEDGTGISGIYYEAHYEMALHQLSKIVVSARSQFDCKRIILHHRIGWVPVAEPSLWVRVTAKHRGPAFETCEWIIEQLKEFVPIWKRPQFESDSNPRAQVQNSVTP